MKHTARTDEEWLGMKSKVLELLEKGVSVIEITKIVGVSRRTVYNWKNDPELVVNKGGAPAKPCNKEQLKELLDDWVPVGAIAKKMGVHEVTVYRWIEKHGFSIRKASVYSARTNLNDREKKGYKLASLFREQKREQRQKQWEGRVYG